MRARLEKKQTFWFAWPVNRFSWCWCTQVNGNKRQLLLSIFIIIFWLWDLPSLIKDNLHSIVLSDVLMTLGKNLSIWVRGDFIGTGFSRQRNSVRGKKEETERQEKKKMRKNREKRCHLHVLVSSNFLFVLFISITVSCRDHMSEGGGEIRRRNKRRPSCTHTCTCISRWPLQSIYSCESGPAESICKVNVACERKERGKVQSVVSEVCWDEETLTRRWYFEGNRFEWFIYKNSIIS